MNRAWGSALLWLAGLIVLPMVAFQLGIEHYDRTYCVGPGDDGDCDLGPLRGLLYATVTLLTYCVATIVIAVRRSRASQETG